MEEEHKHSEYSAETKEAVHSPTEHHHAHAHPHKKKKNGLPMFFIGLGLILIIALLSVVGWHVKQVWSLSTSPSTMKVAKFLHLPVAKINGSSVLYSDYVDDKQALSKFYNGQAAGGQKPDEQEISDQVLSRLVANKLIENLAEKYYATISADDLAKARKDILAPFPDEATVDKQIGEKYGWTLEHYIDRIVKPFLLEQSVGRAFKESKDKDGDNYNIEEAQARHVLVRVTDKKTDAQAKKEATAILKRVVDGKEDFAKVAEELSDDAGSKSNGGLIDWFGKGRMVPEFEAAVFALQPGEIAAQLVKSSYGYHVVKLEGKRTSRNFDTFMRDQIIGANINVVLPVHDPFKLIKEQIKQQAAVPSAAPANADSAASPTK